MFAQLTEPVFGMRRHTLEHILIQMDLKYGTLTSGDLATNEAIVTQPFVDDGGATAMSSFISKQRTAHNVSAANGQPISEAAKVRILKAAVLPCGLFNDTIRLFRAQLPTVVQHTFVALSDRLEAFDDNSAVTMTAGALNYAAAVTAPAQLTKDFTALVPALAPLFAAAAAGPRGDNNKSSGAPNVSRSSKAPRVATNLLY